MVQEIPRIRIEQVNQNPMLTMRLREFLQGVSATEAQTFAPHFNALPLYSIWPVKLTASTGNNQQKVIYYNGQEAEPFCFWLYKSINGTNTVLLPLTEAVLIQASTNNPCISIFSDIARQQPNLARYFFDMNPQTHKPKFTIADFNRADFQSILQAEGILNEGPFKAIVADPQKIENLGWPR